MWKGEVGGMRVQKVNDNTIRIFISFTELADRNISMADLFQRSARTEQLFWELIAQAREEVEFNLDQPFWIQATVASNDEFVITVMKQDEALEEQVREKGAKRATKKRVVEWVYAFGDLEDVIAVAQLFPESPRMRSCLFEMEGEYYVTVSHLAAGKKKQLAEALLDEYGQAADFTKAFLLEHGKAVILDQALPALKVTFGKSAAERAGRK